MSAETPPSPDGHPLLGDTISYARDSLSFVRRSIAQYGDVTRLRILGLGDVYLVGHPELFHQILVEEPEKFSKGADFRTPFGRSVGSTDGETWRRQRQALQGFFHPSNIESYADTMVDIADTHLRWHDGERVPLHTELSKLALDVLFATIFDHRLDIDGTDTDVLRAANDLNLWFNPTSWVLPEWIPTPSRRRFRDAKETLRDEVRRLVREREESPDGDGVISTLLSLGGDTEAGMSDEEIIDNLLLLIFAGHDTTALTLCYTIQNLATHPEVERRFRDEIDTVLDGRTPTRDDLDRLEVTERIIHETMRTHPPTHTLPRTTAEAVTLDGYRIPADSRILLSTWSVHRDPRFWDAPDEWRPERWRDTAPHETGESFIPFGAGRRSCLGREFALQETKAVLATLGRRYRLEPLGELELDPKMTTQPANDVPVRVHRR